MRMKKLPGFILAAAMLLSITPMVALGEASPVEPQASGTVAAKQAEGLVTNSDTGKLVYKGGYSVGAANGDGGVAEIVKYNKDNQKMYIVSGVTQSVDIVSIVDVDAGTYTLDKRIDVTAMAAANGFVSGDITSVAVNTAGKNVGIAVQGGSYKDNGNIVILDYDGNFLAKYETGVQPDMITFTKDGKYALTANEGEPREGYTATSTDPAGSVTIVTMADGTVRTVGFDDYDAKRDQLVSDGVLLKKGTMPSVDLEPEYIAVAEDGKTAYVSLQEANAIGTLDIESGTFTSVKGLGFKDHNHAGNEIDLNKDGIIKIQSENVYGTYMPDGIATANIGGKQYVFTANEGDAREWGTYEAIESVKINGSAKKVEIIKKSEFDGLDGAKTYVLGGRSFSIRQADTMEMVYDSGSDFEKITAGLFPANFNANHKNTEIEGRTNKKGPEPEDVQVFTAHDKTYAVVGLERVGGIMLYDVSTPANANYVDYINVRDFSSDDITNGSHLGPEGITVIEGKNSPTGKPIILVANEVSGTVSVFELQVPPVPKEEPEAPTQPEPQVPGTPDATPVEPATTIDPTPLAPGKIDKAGKAPKMGDITPGAMAALASLIIAVGGLTALAASRRESQ